MTVAASRKPTTDYLDAIAHLPEGGTLIFHHVPWAAYEALLNDLGAGYKARISYDLGRLEVNMPTAIHERWKAFLARLMSLLTDELGLDLEDLGSTTYKFEDWAAGLEPDECFYIANVASILGIKRFDPQTPPPPPDIAVEVDITSESLGRFATYAKLGVPEIWRCDEGQLQIYHLTEAGYVEAERSLTFPFLTGAILFEYLERSLTEGQSATLRAFRQWVQTQPTTRQ
ncbi:MAG: Uma2 family endonuclease [Acidobacteria bacterium]|nr:Uma2 family endonuclease [Acidobacteriota bacterium]